MGKALDTISNYAVPIIATAITGNPAIGAAAAGANSYRQHGDIGSALFSAGGSYLGSQVGGSLLGDTGSVGGAINDTFGTTIGQSIPGNTVSNWIGNVAPSLATSSLSSAIGGFAGNSLAEGLVPPKDSTQSESAGPAPFNPTRAADQSAPTSLTGFGALNPQQQSSNLATQGVYGGGNGPDEQNYFMNLMNHRLVDQSGGVGDISNINPIENSYLSQLGLGGYSDSKNLLEAMSRWHP